MREVMDYRNYNMREVMDYRNYNMREVRGLPQL